MTTNITAAPTQIATTTRGSYGPDDAAEAAHSLPVTEINNTASYIVSISLNRKFFLATTK